LPCPAASMDFIEVSRKLRFASKTCKSWDKTCLFLQLALTLMRALENSGSPQRHANPGIKLALSCSQHGLY
jgi:hypothetical protein